MSQGEAWFWAAFRCPDAEVRDRLVAELAGTGITGSEDTDADAGVNLRAYWPMAVGSDAVRTWSDAAAAATGARVVDHGVQEREDWLAQWKAHFTPLHLTPRLWVCPSWDVPDVGQNEVVIIIEPKMAFGTGHHATTQLCLRLLEEILRPGQTVLDVGTGSGILAIAAVTLGAERATGIDVDPEAVRNASENVALNGLSNRVRIFEQGFSAANVPAADVIVCNMITARLVPLLGGLAACLRGGTLILSGVDQAHRGELLMGLARVGLAARAVRELEGWCAWRVGPRTGGS